MEWIQVIQEYRKRNVGTSIVNQLLYRLSFKADFATVSGKVDNKTKPEKLYRKCGFTGNDISKVQALWADGDVMRFVGFPEGLQQSEEDMKDWYEWLEEARPQANHYCIFENDIYCGESFYEIAPEHNNYASLDIKLFSFARGKGIAAKGLSFAIAEAFKNGANAVWVDPNPNNSKAIVLYKRLGFIEKEIPEYLKDEESEQLYFELSAESTDKLIL